jgi:hypothetical protein
MSTTETELRRLQSRIRDLEDELEDERRRRRRSQRYEGTRAGDWTDLSDRKMDQLSRFFSGTIRATLEGIRVAADSATYFVEDVLERNIPEPDESPVDMMRRMPTDLSRGAMRSFDLALEIPSRAADTFSRTFYGSETGRGRRRRAGTTGYARRGRTTAERDVDYENMTKAELYERASDLNVEGRSEMTKDELAEALRREERPYEEWSKAELYERASELNIEGRSEMTKDDLITAIRAAEAGT